jgi:hypothetical protein
LEKLLGNYGNGYFDQECGKITEEKNREYRSMIRKHFTKAGRDEYSERRRSEKGYIIIRGRNIMENNLTGYKSVM